MMTISETFNVAAETTNLKLQNLKRERNTLSEVRQQQQTASWLFSYHQFHYAELSRVAPVMDLPLK